MKRLFFGLVCITMTTQLALASGFALYEGSSRGNALGGLTGQADDAAVIFFNPAGMTNLEGTHFMGGGTIIIPWADIDMNDIYSGQTTDGELEDQVFTPPHIYFTHQINDRLWVGGGVYTRFGLGTKYEPSWEGRYSNINTQIQSISYGVDLAYKVNDNFSVAFGVSAMWFDAVLEQAVDANLFQLNPPHNPATTDFDAIQKIEGNNTSYGWEVSAHYHNDKWGVGFLYVSGVDHDLEGVATWTKPSAPVPDLWFNDANVTADTIELPDMMFFGVSYNVNDKVSVGGGLVRTGWSSIVELVFHYETPFAIIPGLGSLDVASRDLRWEDTWRYNFGVEYAYNDTITLMGGYVFDESPLIDETVSYLLPTNDRDLLNTGISIKRNEWLITGGYTYLLMKDRVVESRQIEDGVLAGETGGGAHLLSLSLSRKF